MRRKGNERSSENVERGVRRNERQKEDMMGARKEESGVDGKRQKKGKTPQTLV